MRTKDDVMGEQVVSSTELCSPRRERERRGEEKEEVRKADDR